MEYRAFRSGDVSRLVELTTAAMPADAVSTTEFAENILLDAAFDPAGLIIAVEPGTAHPAGFVHAVRGSGDSGWITIGCVHPRFRRRGVGAELLWRALAFLRVRGAAWTEYSGYPPAYFLPGLDADAYPEGLRLLERHGFHTTSRPVAMDRHLTSYVVPEAVAVTSARRAAEGYTFAPAVVDDLPEAITFAATRLAPDWGEVIRAAMVRYGRPDRLVVARDPDRVIVGLATYGAYQGRRERFGPFGVDDRRRGLGLGAIVLHTTLARMRAEGVPTAWFLWTGLDTPAGRLYSRAGFAVTRTFHVLRADLG